MSNENKKILFLFKYINDSFLDKNAISLNDLEMFTNLFMNETTAINKWVTTYIDEIIEYAPKNIDSIIDYLDDDITSLLEDSETSINVKQELIDLKDRYVDLQVSDTEYQIPSVKREELVMQVGGVFTRAHIGIVVGLSVIIYRYIRSNGGRPRRTEPKPIAEVERILSFSSREKFGKRDSRRLMWKIILEDGNHYIVKISKVPRHVTQSLLQRSVNFTVIGSYLYEGKIYKELNNAVKGTELEDNIIKLYDNGFYEFTPSYQRYYINQRRRLRSIRARSLTTARGQQGTNDNTEERTRKKVKRTKRGKLKIKRKRKPTFIVRINDIEYDLNNIELYSESTKRKEQRDLWDILQDHPFRSHTRSNKYSYMITEAPKGYDVWENVAEEYYRQNIDIDYYNDYYKQVIDLKHELFQKYFFVHWDFHNFNCLFNPNTKKVKLFDFDFSTMRFLNGKFSYSRAMENYNIVNYIETLMPTFDIKLIYYYGYLFDYYRMYYETFTININTQSGEMFGDTTKFIEPNRIKEYIFHKLHCGENNDKTYPEIQSIKRKLEEIQRRYASSSVKYFNYMNLDTLVKFYHCIKNYIGEITQIGQGKKRHKIVSKNKKQKNKRRKRSKRSKQKI